MTDSRSTFDEQLPWLQAVEDEDGPRGVSARKMLLALLLVVVAALIVAGTFFWLGRQNGETPGAPELIRAEPGPYKVRPENPGGLDVAGESETAFQTSAGEETDAELDLGRVPEAPIARPAPPQPKPDTPTDAETPAATAPEAPSGGSGSVIQLGAYNSAGQAQRGWDALSARFPLLAGMNKLIVPFSGGYRLRAGAASPAQAREACQALKVAGESCFVAN